MFSYEGVMSFVSFTVLRALLYFIESLQMLVLFASTIAITAIALLITLFSPYQSLLGATPHLALVTPNLS